MTGQHDRDKAYRLKDSGAHRSFYDDWSKRYNDEFAKGVSYIYPERLARAFLETSVPDDDPIIDIGCGTGLAGTALKGSGRIVDGLDISPGMLRQAQTTEAYRYLFEVDLTDTSTLPSQRYGGLISCGTFTLGHLGPPALKTALGLARPGAHCVIGVNRLHYETESFDSMMNCLLSNGRITTFSIRCEPIYAKVDEPEAPVNWANLVVFRTGDR
ncbi:MAG: methyltransferase domain-containing protein [Paracoccaceae bacterium]|nr:methyltransferase domain-containing protein [Paracoccaceae bacterium]